MGKKYYTLRKGDRVTAILMDLFTAAISYEVFGFWGPMIFLLIYAIGVYNNREYLGQTEKKGREKKADEII